MATSPHPVVRNRLWPVWYSLALAFGAIASGRWTVATAAWLFPLFLVRAMRSHGILVAYLLAVGAAAIAGIVGWRGTVPGLGEGWLFVAVVSGVALIEALPFLVDRILYPRIRGFSATLVLPCSVVAYDFLWGFLGPSTGLLGYSLFGMDSLVQVSSVTGVWGLTFLVAWIASAANLFWEQGFRLEGIRASVLAPAALLLLVMIGGGLRLALAPSAVETVRVALLAPPIRVSDEAPWLDPDAEQRYWSGGALDDEAWREFGARTARVHDRLLAKSAREAEAGARLIFWAEANAPVRNEDEEPLIARGAALAEEHGIYLGMSLLVLPRDMEEKFRNKMVVVTPEGGVAVRYRKAIPVPGLESEFMEAGDGRIGVVDTPYGRIGIAICYDLDFIRAMHQVGEQEVDILVGPAMTWPAIARLHMEMATFRAVEHGVSLVRPALDGVSVATDPYGRVIARMEDWRSTSYATTAEVPVRGVPTLYSRLGDWIGWLSVLGIGALAIAGMRPGISSAFQHPQSRPDSDRRPETEARPGG